MSLDRGLFLASPALYGGTDSRRILAMTATLTA